MNNSTNIFAALDTKRRSKSGHKSKDGTNKKSSSKSSVSSSSRDKGTGDNSSNALSDADAKALFSQLGSLSKSGGSNWADEDEDENFADTFSFPDTGKAGNAEAKEEEENDDDDDDEEEEEE